METSEEPEAVIATAAKIRIEELNQGRTLFGPRPINQPARRARSPNLPPSTAPQAFQRLDYIATSSPLETQKEVPSGAQSTNGSRQELDLDELEDRKLPVPRRSLQVWVVDTMSGTALIPPSSEISTNSNTGSFRSQGFITPLLKQKPSDSSFNSVGDYSRYPDWPHTGVSASILSPVYSEWDGDSMKQSSINTKFNEEDPEHGFSPYFKDGGMAVQYPTIDEKEDDDKIHNPNPNEQFRSSFKRAFMGVLCISMTICGVFVLFIVWPVLQHTGYGRHDKEHNKSDPVGEESLSRFVYPILETVRNSLIDPDTPQDAMTRESVIGGGRLKLVFSDEFNKDGRSFYENDDPFWQAVDLHYAATDDLEWYDPDAVTTKDGSLRVRLDPFKNHNLNYRSGMLQSWNKLCFKGGVLEISASLPGPAGVSGLWPGVWTLGNLARPGYLSTTDGVWPYAYDGCDAGIAPNQSSSDDISFLPGQKLAKCVCEGEQHPSAGTGRGAPEIDIFEASADGNLKLGTVSQSIQIAPFDTSYRPNYDFLAIKNPKITQFNSWKGGPFQQDISGVTTLNNDWYDRKQFQKYALEYIPGKASGVVAWFVGDEETFRMTGEAIGPDGNVGQRDISREPMSIVLNLGFSTSWAYIDWNLLGSNLNGGATMYIDYVRIYQEEGKRSITCDPHHLYGISAGFPTTKYIQDHLSAYMNANFTSWKDTGYPWPKNPLVQGC